MTMVMIMTMMLMMLLKMMLRTDLHPLRARAPGVLTPLVCSRPWCARAPGLSRPPTPPGIETGMYFDSTLVCDPPGSHSPQHCSHPGSRQPSSSSVILPVRQTVNQSGGHSVSQSIKMSISQSVNQSASQSFLQSVNQ